MDTTNLSITNFHWISPLNRAWDLYNSSLIVVIGNIFLVPRLCAVGAYDSLSGYRPQADTPCKLA